MRVAGLFVYPIKACAGSAVERARVGTYGLDHDRHWMVVDAADRAELTQRTVPALARVRPALVDAGLVLTGEGADPLEVATPAVADATATVWGWQTPVGDAGAAAADWLSSFIGRDCRLVAVAEGYRRPVNPRRDRRDRQVGFADGYPLLLCTEESLAELNRLASEPVPMDRFRPNLVVAGTPAPWVEDSWGALDVAGVAFDVVKGCARCAVPQVDQRTGARHPEPARVLAAHRRADDGKTYFGQNLVHVDVGGWLAVGDEVRARPR